MGWDGSGAAFRDEIAKHCGAHTRHHDQVAHDGARRRYAGLHVTAASTGFPEEATACRAKAELLRAKHGL